MKIEPRKRSDLPKYAAALAALSMVPALTGCGIVQPDGMTEVYTEPEPSELQYDGEVWVDSPEERAPAERFAEEAFDALQKGFAAAHLGNTYQPQNSHGEADSVLYHNRWTALGFSDPDNRVFVCFYDGSAPASLDDCEDSAPGCETLSAWYAHFAQKTFDWGCADVFDPADYIGNETFRAAFVDITKYETLTAEDAAQILNDLLTAFPETGEEGET